MDEKDKEILKILEKDSSLSSQEIGKQTKIPITTVHNRIKKLQKDGIIKKFTISINHAKLGKPVSAIILVTINYDFSSEKINQLDIAKKIRAYEDVTDLQIVTGSTDIVIRIQTESIDHLNEFIINYLRPIPGIDKTQTMIVLKEI